MIENGDYGYDIGYGVIYRLNKRLSLGADLNYSDRYRKEIEPITQQTVKYIGLHQKLYYKIGKVFKPYTGFGLNYLIAKRSSADIDFESTRFHYSSVDLSIQLGVTFKFTCFELFADFHYGLNPQRKIALLDLDTEVVVNSKSRLLRVGLSHIIEGKDDATGKKKRRKKRKRKKR